METKEVPPKTNEPTSAMPEKTDEEDKRSFADKKDDTARTTEVTEDKEVEKPKTSDDIEEHVTVLGDGLPNLVADDKEEIGDDKGTDPEGPNLLDLAFAMDCTGSMGSYISQAQHNIRRIVEDIVSKEQADIRLALVEYRDHPPQDSSFVTRVHDFTHSVRDMKSWLDACEASGGGDGPEAVADALQQVLKLSWRQEATKMCVFISDAPPHGLGMDSGDGFPNGCPDGIDPMHVVNQMAEKSITLYLVGCEPAINRYKEFFTAIAHVTGGQYVPLRKANLLSAVIAGGAQEEISLQRLMEEVNQEVEQELEDCDEGGMEYGDLASRVYSKLKSRGYKTQQMQMNSAQLPKASMFAQEMSYCKDLSDVRKKVPQKDSYYNRRRGVGMEPHSSSMRTKSHSASGRGGEDRGGKGIMATIYKWFGFGRTERAEEELCGDDSITDREEELRHDLASIDTVALESSCSTSRADVYEVVDEDIAEEQVFRMVNKSLAMNNLKSKTVAKKS